MDNSEVVRQRKQGHKVFGGGTGKLSEQIMISIKVKRRRIKGYMKGKGGSESAQPQCSG